jgi:hypothetical protein
MIFPLETFTYFSMITSLYFVLKYLLCEKTASKKKGSLAMALTVSYLILMVLFQFGANMANATEKCNGTPQILPVISYTLAPNIFIFGALLVALMLFPGWKAPFSNTLGYLTVKLMGVESVFLNILKPEEELPKLLSMVYKDPSMMINEITPENFDTFLYKMEESDSILNDYIKDDDKDDLYKLVVIKDRVADFMWYMFTGYLVIQNSFSYIMSIKCKRNSDELANELDNVLDNPVEIKEATTWGVSY